MQVKVQYGFSEEGEWQGLVGRQWRHRHQAKGLPAAVEDDASGAAAPPLPPTTTKRVEDDAAAVACIGRN
jgi:hypothetical protein